jgi:hypothetical protein
LRFDPVVIAQRLRNLPTGMRSSILKDALAGAPLELDAIAGPVLRGLVKIVWAVGMADPLEQYPRPAGAWEAAGELLAVVGQDLLRAARILQGAHERCADCPRGAPRHHRGDQAEPGVIVNSRDDLHF